MDDGSTYACPHCQQVADVTEAPPGAVVRCPHCGGEFSLPEIPAADERDSELDGLRIRQLSTLRRSAYRSRSYAIIAAGACVVVMAQLVLMTVRHVRVEGWSGRPIGYLIFTLFAAWGAWYFIGRAVHLHRETKRSALVDPQSAPDFSKLSDGSQRVKNLEDVR